MAIPFGIRAPTRDAGWDGAPPVVPSRTESASRRSATMAQAADECITKVADLEARLTEPAAG